jgi:hypothetical protein
MNTTASKSWHRLAKLGGQRSGPSHQPSASLAFCVAGRGSYSEPMVPGSEGSVGPGVSRQSSGGCSVSPGCPLLRSSRSTRAIRSWSYSSEASRSCWSESNCWSSGSNVLTFPSVPSSIYPSSPRPLLLSQSSYFWPLGMMAPLRDLACCSSCSLVTPARRRSVPRRSAPLRLAANKEVWYSVA